MNPKEKRDLRIMALPNEMWVHRKQARRPTFLNTLLKLQIQSDQLLRMIFH